MEDNLYNFIIFGYNYILVNVFIIFNIFKFLNMKLVL